MRVHYQPSSFRILCGASYYGKRTTLVTHEVTCKKCQRMLLKHARKILLTDWAEGCDGQ